jgi:hypothetical protein
MRIPNYSVNAECAQLDLLEAVKSRVEVVRFRHESLPFVAGSATSKQAAEEAKPSAATLRGQVREFLRKHGPATDETIQRELGMNPNTQRPRRIELVTANFVRDSGGREKTSSGRDAVLWECVP